MATAHAPRPATGQWIFGRVLVGIDGTERALEAARQAAVLQDVDGQLTLLAAWDVAPIIGGTGTEVPSYHDESLQRARAETALQTAGDDVDLYSAPKTILVRGAPVSALLSEIDLEEDTLVAVGASSPRVLGNVEGSVDGVRSLGSLSERVAHSAAGSVLVVRTPVWQRIAEALGR